MQTQSFFLFLSCKLLNLYIVFFHIHTLFSDPPVDPKNIPSGEWLCRRCRDISVDKEMPPIFKPLIDQAYVLNPLIFDIPPELHTSQILPGTVHVIGFVTIVVS